jgi:Tol biopolymer transport system component
VPFDMKRSRLTGPAFPVLTGVQAFENGAVWRGASDGTIVYLPFDSASADRELVWIADDGKTVLAGGQAANFRSHAHSGIALSPSGDRVAFTDLAHIGIYDLSRDVLTELPGDDFKADVPLWSPDGRFIVYAAENSASGLYVVDAEGNVPPRLLLRSEGQPFPHSWSSDGKTIAISMQKAAGRERDIWMLDAATGKATPFVQTPSYETSPTFSPDGRWVAYTSYTVSTSVVAIHIARYPGGDHDQTIGTAQCPGDCYAVVPRWSRNGRDLFFWSSNKMMVVNVDTRGGEFKAAKPRELFETEIFDFDVAPDGRFIAARAKRAPRWDHVNMVSGWWDGSGSSNR